MKATEAYTALCSPGPRPSWKRAEVLGRLGARPFRSRKRRNLQPEVWKAKFKAAADEYAALVAFQPKTDGKLDLRRRRGRTTGRPDFRVGQ